MEFWRKEFSTREISHILEKIRSIRMVGTNGRVSFIGGEYEYWITILVSAVGADTKSDALREKIIASTLSSDRLLENFTEKDFRDLFYKFRYKYEQEDTKIYRVAFPIWNLPPFLKGKKKKNDVILNFTPSKGSRVFKRVLKERQSQYKNPMHDAFFTKEKLADLQRCSICLAHVRANNPADAHERAAEALYEVLGLVNISIDGRKYWRSSSRAAGKFPVSDVLIGPHTTTHLENGSLSHDGFWYERWVGGPSQRKLSQDQLEAWKVRFTSLEKGVSDSFWQQQCKYAVVRYFKAFSNPDLEEAFFEGWRLFENISGSQNEKFKQKISRASNIFEDNFQHQIIGRHLSLRRNLIAHGHAIKSEDDETLVFQMLQFVVPFLKRFIWNKFKFASQGEFWEFLNLPSARNERIVQKSEYKRRLALLEKAAKFRGETNS